MCMQICHKLHRRIQWHWFQLRNPEFTVCLHHGWPHQTGTDQHFSAAASSVKFKLENLQPPETLQSRGEKMAKRGRDAHPAKWTLTCWVHRRVFRSQYRCRALGNFISETPPSPFWAYVFELLSPRFKQCPIPQCPWLGEDLEACLDVSPQHCEFT